MRRWPSVPGLAVAGTSLEPGRHGRVPARTVENPSVCDTVPAPSAPAERRPNPSLDGPGSDMRYSVNVVGCVLVLGVGTQVPRQRKSICRASGRPLCTKTPSSVPKAATAPSARHDPSVDASHASAIFRPSALSATHGGAPLGARRSQVGPRALHALSVLTRPLEVCMVRRCAALIAFVLCAPAAGSPQTGEHIIAVAENFLCGGPPSRSRMNGSRKPPDRGADRVSPFSQPDGHGGLLPER